MPSEGTGGLDAVGVGVKVGVKVEVDVDVEVGVEVEVGVGVEVGVEVAVGVAPVGATTGGASSCLHPAKGNRPRLASTRNGTRDLCMWLLYQRRA